MGYAVPVEREIKLILVLWSIIRAHVGFPLRRESLFFGKDLYMLGSITLRTFV